MSADKWKKEAHIYLGMATSGFPTSSSHMDHKHLLLLVTDPLVLKFKLTRWWTF